MPVPALAPVSLEMDMKEISLTRGKVALVDDEDYERISLCSWHTLPSSKTCYAQRSKNLGSKNGNQNITTFSMHRDILGLPQGRFPEVDHKDGNGLNNQKSNLRVATHTQNMANVRTYPHTSKYRGVSLYRSGNYKRWRSSISSDGTKHFLGYFLTEAGAAIVYNAASLEFHGEFGRLNNI